MSRERREYFRTSTPPKPGREPRPICPVCKQPASIDRHGRFYRHRDSRPGPYAWCYGPKKE